MKRNYIRVALFAFANLLIVTSGFPQVSIYVSPEGSDKNKGTMNRPYQTIARAVTAVKAITKDETEDVTVYLRQGVYSLDQPLIFSQEDGGSEHYKVKYQAYGNEQPVISGGFRISEWQHHENGIYKASVPVESLRRLYVNNVAAIRARFPNEGDYRRISVWDIENKLIYINSGDLPQWEENETVEMHIQMRWSGSIVRVTSAETNQQEGFSPGASGIITLAEPERTLIFSRDYPQKRSGQSYHFENSYHFLDQPGEFYFDQNNQLLYYMPEAGEKISQSEIVVPRLETLVKLEGTLDKPVTNLEFHGITFAHSGWSTPDKEGCLVLEYGQYTIEPTRDNIQYVQRPPAMFMTKAANNIRIERNVFSCAGATGLDFHFGTSNSTIIGNVFRHIAGNGISYSKFSDPDQRIHVPFNPEDARELSRNDSISNNYLKNVGTVYLGSAGIACGYPQSIVIAHNEVSYMPTAGIAVGWGWTSEDNAMKNNQVLNNNVHHVMQLMEDNGGIKFLSKQPNSLLSGNWVHDIEISEWAQDQFCPQIYLDEATEGYLIKNNALEEPNGEAFRFHRVGKNIIEDCCQGYNEDIHRNAGLQDEYKDIRLK